MLEFTQPIRCYNGAFDTASQRILDAQDGALTAIRRTEPKAHVTFFPMEEEWVVHVYGRQLSSYHKSKGSALADALERLK